VVSIEGENRGVVDPQDLNNLPRTKVLVGEKGPGKLFLKIETFIPGSKENGLGKEQQNQ